MIRALLVDDEEPARLRLRAMLENCGDIEVIGEAADGPEALRKICDECPDLVFLDIQMPGPSGMEVAASLPPPRPRIIFCTAFDRYAINAFEQHATDYLLKPVGRKRLERALGRVRRSIDEEHVRAREEIAASRAQARLLPQSSPRVSGLDYAGSCRAAQGVGGDYYDFLAIGESVGIAVGDVSGKGLYAGLLAASLQARVQSLAPLSGHDLRSMFAATNRSMHESTESHHYATLFYGVYSPNSRELNYVNAGHVPPLLIRGETDAGERVERLGSTGTAVGLLPDSAYEEGIVRLSPGDVLLIYTDGLIEASNASGDEFGEAHLAERVARLSGLPAAQLRDAILAEVDRFVGNAPRRDDLTLVTVKVT